MRDTANRWAICSGLMVCSSILLDVLSPATSSAATCEPPIAKAMAIEGKVDVRSTDSSQWRPVKLNDTFCPGDLIRVQERSRADIALSNQPMLRLDQNTTMTLGGVKKEGGSVVELAKGAMHFFSRLPRNLDIKTAFVNAGVEGTEGVVKVGDEKAEVTIFEGKVVAANESGTVTITNGQSVVAETSKPLRYQTVVKPRDAVQWALHYPPVIDRKAGEAGEAQSLTNRAADALAVGRVDEAKADLDRALKTDPRSADALALQSIIAVVQNDKEQALGLATSAVAANPQSASAKIALSYAQQANFDVEGALKSLQEAVKAEPDNTLAWSRLAEMHLSLQQLDKGLAAAQKAVELNSDVERAHTVLGFAYLLQVKTKEAQAEFAKAHELDQAAALPQLGLGLAKFREGKIEDGRREMEVAASLDPNNAMIRSYLGKAYFEEKKTNLTEREYQNAKELDPKDPTPFFYDALQKQLTNRPVEALKDMETAIELNKNRAVYRSQLQMDSDLAARSASLGRIYTDLGFEQVALVEAWTSITQDPSSYTAARFLADTYASRERSEVARTSELLRSQLLQPINVTPIAPSQAVSNLLLLSSLGPTGTSFNEFNTLMVNRDRLTFLGSGLYGSNATSAGEGIVSGIFGKLSFSAGYSNFSTDGWRPNAIQKDSIANVFMQYELSSQTSIQAEYRYRNLQAGDVQQRFFDNNFQPNFINAEARNTFRIGGRHSFTPNSTLLVNFTYLKSSEQQTFAPPNAPEPLPGVPITFIQIDGKQYKQDSYKAEVQHLLRIQNFNLVTGAHYAQQNGHPTFRVDLDFGGPFTLVNQGLPLLYQHYNAYAYGYFKPVENLTLIAGGSQDYVVGSPANVPGQNSANSMSSFNPKFGLLYQPHPNTTIRLAAFRALKGLALNEQTIEPTQVAGFNQFYDDLAVTEGWRYGGAVNQKFSKTLFGGVEGSYRNVNIPVFNALDTTVQPTNVNAWYQAIGYLNYAPHPWVALRASYQYDQYENSVPSVGQFSAQQLYTSRVPLSAGFFHPSGMIANVTITYWNQSGTFEPLSAPAGTRVDGHDTFWLTDFMVGYRMPNRYGLIAVGVKNAFDQKFQYFNTDWRNPLIQPERLVFFKITIALP
ncbi:MAG: TonB-dependent receptor [Nitrospira sp.]|nr:TonB-dependent receptor [Nitrospira sp.]